MDPLRVTVPNDIDKARNAVADALATEGFGVLTEIDVQAIMRAKLGVEQEGHRILGVCNPRFAKGALDIDRDVALLLPCTVTLHEVPGGTEVRVQDPEAAFTLASAEARDRLAPLAVEVARRLGDALARLAPN